MGNRNLAKVLMAILTLEIVLTTGLPMNTRVKRSPSDNISFFGFGRRTLTKPVSLVQQSFSNLGSIFTPSVNSRHNNFNSQIPIEPEVRNVKPSKDNVVNSYPSWINNGFNKNEDNERGNKNSNNIKFPDSNDNLKNDEKELRPIDNKYDNKNLGSVDQELVDSIFRNEIYFTSTTEDTTATDYTTETGDYETTTGGDDLLRIPAPVVASLLG